MGKEKLTKILKVWGLPIFAVLIFISALIFSEKGEDNPNINKDIDLETEMSELVSSFYDKYIKGMTVGIHRHIVTLKDLEAQEYNINHFTILECDMESFSYVILDDPMETDIAKIKYTIEHHLDCKK